MLGLCCGLLLRSGLILAVAELIRRRARSSTAAARHRLVLAAFALLLLWPLLSAVLPEISLVWAPQTATGTVTTEQKAMYLLAQQPSGLRPYGPVMIWLAGFVLTLVPLMVSHRRVHHIVRNASILDRVDWRNLLNAECSRLGVTRPPKLLLHPSPLVPFTFGIWRPGIVVPAGCVDWTDVRRRAVLMHELAHIARRDLLWQWFAHLATALWWFQPLCWVSRFSLRWESEQACDAMVVTAGVLPSDYAQELLLIAQDFRNGQLWSSGAIAMVRQGELTARLQAILRPQAAFSKWLPAAGTAVLLMLAWAASAVTIFPERSFEPGGYNMKHTVLSGLLVSVGLSAATITGATAPLPHTVANSSKVDAKNDQTTNTEDRNQKVIRVGGEVAQANLVTKVQPVYPASAKQAGIQGEVLIDATISKEGVPEELQVTSSPSDDLSQSALDAVSQWRYRPTLLNGSPVAIQTVIEVHYTLAK